MITLCLTLVLGQPTFALTHPELNTLLEAPIQVREQVCREHREECLKRLSVIAFDGRAGLERRWRAVTTIGRVSAEHMSPSVEQALKSREWFMRNAGLIAVQTAPREMALNWSTKLLSDPALVVRTQAVRNLIALNASEAEPRLWHEIFESRNFRSRESLWIRGYIAEALAKLSSSGHKNDFKRLLLESDERLHKWAVLGLERSTGMKITDDSEPIEMRRQKWLSRLGVESI